MVSVNESHKHSRHMKPRPFAPFLIVRVIVVLHQRIHQPSFWSYDTVHVPVVLMVEVEVEVEADKQTWCLSTNPTNTRGT
jgi:hypothetical protein